MYPLYLEFLERAKGATMLPSQKATKANESLMRWKHTPCQIINKDRFSQDSQEDFESTIL